MRKFFFLLKIGEFHEKGRKNFGTKKNLSLKDPTKKFKMHFCHFEKSFRNFFLEILKKKFSSEKFV